MTAVLSPFRSRIFLRVVAILVITLIVGLTGNEPAQSATESFDPEPLTYKFTGNHEVHYVVGVPDASGVGYYSVELFRNGVLRQIYLVVGYYNVCDSGLPRDEVFLYDVDIYWHYNGQKIYSGTQFFTTTTGEVAGTPLCDVYVAAYEDYDIVGRVRLDDTMLFIPRGVTVENHSSIPANDTQGLIHVTAGGRLDIRGGQNWDEVTLTDIAIGQSADGDLFIKNAEFNRGRLYSEHPTPTGTTYFYGNTFNDFHSIYKFGINSAGLVFENNTGNCTSSTGLWFVAAEGAGNVTVANNEMPSCNFMLSSTGDFDGSRIPAVNVNINDNDFESLIVHSGEYSDALVTIRDNTIAEDLGISKFQKSVNASNNQISGGIELYELTIPGYVNVLSHHIVNNRVSNTISLEKSSVTQIAQNTLICSDNSMTGLLLTEVTYSEVSENTIAGCSTGIRLDGRFGKNVTVNTIKSNEVYLNQYNLVLDGAVYDNTIYNNIFNAPVILNVYTYGLDCSTNCANAWNISKTPGENIVSGPNLGGNYWSDYTGTDADLDGIGDVPRPITTNNVDELPLGGNLIIENISLSEENVYFEFSRYKMPAVVTLWNLSTFLETNVQLYLLDNGDWNTQIAVGDMDPGERVDVAVTWDITNILAAGQGRANVSLTAGVGNSYKTKTELVDARPAITEILPTYWLDNAYFLNTLSVINTVQALVDWNGALTGTNTAPFGDVYFSLNDVATQIAGVDWGAQTTYDMGTGFDSGLACQNNTLKIWAARATDFGDFVSPEVLLQPTVQPYPAWANGLIASQGGDFSVESASPLVYYAYDFILPEAPFAHTWTPPGWVPYFGGHEIGLLPTQAGLTAIGQSDGAGQVLVGGETGFTFANIGLTGAASGAGITEFTCDQSLNFNRADVSLNFDDRREIEAGLLEVVPTLEDARDLWLVGELFDWIAQTGRVRTSFETGSDLSTAIENVNDQLAFTGAAGLATVQAQVESNTLFAGNLGVSVYGGGAAQAALITDNDGLALEEIGINMLFTANLQAWNFENQYTYPVYCAYQPGQPLSCPAPPAPQDWGVRGVGGGMNGLDQGWQLIPRKRTESRPGDQQTTSVNGLTTEEVLVTDIYPRPEPALVVRSDGERMLVYVEDDPTIPNGFGTELQALHWNGSTWSGPNPITDNTWPDFSPALAFDGFYRAVLVWERAAVPTDISPTLNITYAQSLEIVSQVWNGAAWGAEILLTDNDRMDHAPQVAATTDGRVLALWQTSDGNTLIGTPTNPITLTYAWWDPNSGAWSSPAAALTNGQGIFDPAGAAHSSTLAALAYVQDVDLDLGTVADAEIMIAFYDGNAWGTPIQLTNDSTADHSPALAYDASGKLHIFWLSGDQLMWLPERTRSPSTDFTDAQALPVTRFETGILGYEVSRDTGGNLGVVWQSMNAGQSDLVYSLYDSANDDWGAPQALLENASLEAAHSPAFEPDGNLSLAYQKIGITLTDQTVIISPTLTITVTSMPTAGQSDLAFSNHTMGHDLTLENLTVKPENLSAGETITVTVVLRNQGDWTAPSPQVGFYVDDALLGPVQTLPDLQAGFTATVQIQWTFPVTTTPQAIVAKADPADSLDETDETNNQLSTTVPQVDLAVNRFYAVVEADELILTALVENLAGFDSTLPFSVTFRLEDPFTGTQIASTWLGTISAGALMTVTVSIEDASSLSENQIWVILDPANWIAERDEQNNIRPARFTVEIWHKVYLPLVLR